jgi:multiple sugar transport system ATP-binding protein
MGFALRLAGVPRSARDAKVAQVADVLQLGDLLDRKPKQLSGGQRQRVAIGRAMVREPRVFLFDEPLSNLDAALRVKMRIELARLHDRLGVTMIYVTHDQVEAMTLADKIVVLRDGQVEQVGAPLKLYHHPANQFVAGFIGSPTMNFIAVDVASVAASGVEVRLPQGAVLSVPVESGRVQVGSRLVLGIRPEHMRPLDQGPLRGEILVVERLGGQTYLYVQVTDKDLLIVLAAGACALQVHQATAIGFTGQDCHLFAGDGTALAPLARDRHLS